LLVYELLRPLKIILWLNIPNNKKDRFIAALLVLIADIYIYLLTLIMHYKAQKKRRLIMPP